MANQFRMHSTHFPQQLFVCPLPKPLPPPIPRPCMTCLRPPAVVRWTNWSTESPKWSRRRWRTPSSRATTAMRCPNGSQNNICVKQMLATDKRQMHLDQITFSLIIYWFAITILGLIKGIQGHITEHVIPQCSAIVNSVISVVYFFGFTGREKFAGKMFWRKNLHLKFLRNIASWF